MSVNNPYTGLIIYGNFIYAKICDKNEGSIPNLSL